MENASKALIMVAGILIGILIITIAVVLFRSFSDFGHSTYEKLEDAKISEWNSTYLKYYGKMETENSGKKSVPIPVTAHDIVTMANHAMQNNMNYEFDDTANAEENSYYVRIDIKKSKNVMNNINNFEKDKNKEAFLQNYSLKMLEMPDGSRETRPIYFKIKELRISNATRKVYYVIFEEFTDNEYNIYYDFGLE